MVYVDPSLAHDNDNVRMSAHECGDGASTERCSTSTAEAATVSGAEMEIRIIRPVYNLPQFESNFNLTSKPKSKLELSSVKKLAAICSPKTAKRGLYSL